MIQPAFLEKVFFSFPASFLCFLLVFPVLLFSFHLDSLAWPQEDPFLMVFFMTLFQAGSSTLLSVIFGLLGSRGLLSLAKKKYYFLFEGFVLLPCLIPPLLLVLSVLHLIGTMRPFPFGLPALIFTQSLTYTGLCTVVFSRSVLRQGSSLSAWAFLQKSSPCLFLKSLVLSFLWKDVKTLSALTFTGSFTSLSLPLLAGGNPIFSLEFFIYEKLKDPELWPQAMSLIAFQSVLIFVLCLKAFSGKSSADLKFPFQSLYLLPNRIFLLIPFGAVFFSLGGLFFISDLRVLSKISALSPFLLPAGRNSLFLSLGVGALTLLFLTFLSLSFQNKKARKFIASFMPPGVSFMGFAFLLWPEYGEAAVLLKWILGLSFLLFPLIYRFQGERALEQLSGQVETARFLGADWTFIFRKIIWPQSRSVFFLCAGLSSFWACGDFAYSLIVASGHQNLSLLIYDVFSSYRLEEAVLLSWLLLGLSFFVFLFWLGLDFVCDKKFIL